MVTFSVFGFTQSANAMDNTEGNPTLDFSISSQNIRGNYISLFLRIIGEVFTLRFLYRASFGKPTYRVLSLEESLGTVYASN